jgi:hypothetical protein
LAPNGTGSVNVSGAKIINLATPVSSTDAATKAYVDSMVGTGTITFDSLTDVTITTPTNGQTVTYDSISGQWVNTNSYSSLSSLTDVSMGSSPVSGQVLAYNGTKWVPSSSAAASSLGGLSDVALNSSILATTQGQFLTYNISTQKWVNTAPVFLTEVKTDSGNAVYDIDYTNIGSVSILGGTGISTSASGSFVTVTNTHTAISLMDDVDYTTPPVADQFLQFNGTNWVPYTMPNYALYSITSIGADDSNSISVNSNSASISVNGTNGITTSVTGNSLKVNFTANVEQLKNVQVTGLSNGDSLVYNSATSKWVNAHSSNSISGLSDVDVTTLANNYILQYNNTSGKWVSVPLPTSTQNTFSTFITDDSSTATASSPASSLNIKGLNGIITSVQSGDLTIGHSIKIEQLSDVSISNPSSGQIITWNGLIEKYDDKNDIGWLYSHIKNGKN